PGCAIASFLSKSSIILCWCPGELFWSKNCPGSLSFAAILCHLVPIDNSHHWPLSRSRNVGRDPGGGNFSRSFSIRSFLASFSCFPIISNSLSLALQSRI